MPALSVATHATNPRSIRQPKPIACPMDPDVYTFLAVCAVVVGSVGALVAIGVSARVRLLRAERGSNAPRIDENRLQHLEQAVDAIAIEIERISESQRFTTKLLADRERESLH